MATYGSYETVGRIFSIGARSVYSAREADGGKKDVYVVKILATDDVFGEDPEASARAFAARAQIQTNLTEAKAKAWVGAYAHGTQGDEVYYVTDRVPNSAQQLLAGKVRLSHADLLRVVGRVIEGLRELRSIAQRSHGNLKPSNILIESGGDIAKAKILLTDPSGGAEAARRESEHEDVRAIGDLIHQLVLMAPFRAMGGYPITESANWTRLGKSGEQWRALCNRLLDPGAAPGSISVEAIAGEIQQFKGEKGGGGLLVPAVVGVVALAALGGGGYFAWKSLSGSGRTDPLPNPDRFDRQAWARWCLSSRWAVEMRSQLAARRQTLESDAFLKERLAPLLDSGAEVDLQAKFTVRNPASYAQTDLPQAREPEGVEATRQALEWIDGVEEVLTDAKWPAAAALRASAERLEALDLHSFANLARQHAAAYEVAISGVGVVTDVERSAEGVAPLLDAVSKVATTGSAFEELLEAVEERDPAPAVSGSPLRLRANDILAASTGGLAESDVRQLAAYIRTEYEPPTERGPVVVVPPPPEVVIGPDPRLDASWDVPARLREVRSSLGESWTGQVRGDGAQAIGDARGAAGEVDALLGGDIALEWTPENRDRIERAMSQARSRTTVSAAAVERARGLYDAQVRADQAAQQAAQQTAAQAAAALASFVEEFRAAPVPEGVRSSFLVQEWARRRDEQVAGATDPARRSEYELARETLRGQVVRVESELPMPPEITEGPAGFDAGAIGRSLAAARERAMEEIWRAGVAGDFGEAFAASARERAASLTDLYDSARRYAREMALAETAMASLRGWDEPLTSATPAETLETIAARWEASPPTPEVVAAVGDVQSRLAALGQSTAQVRAAGTREALAAIAMDAGQPLQSAVLAYRSMPEDTGVGLQEEQRVVPRLRAALGAVADPAGARVLSSVNAEASRRWQNAVERAGTRAEFETAMASKPVLAPDFQIAELSARAFFNVRLLSAIQPLEGLGAGASDADVRAALERIIALADQNRAAWQGDPRMVQWLDQIRGALSQQASGPDLTRVGPAASGAFTYDAASSTPSRAIYRQVGGSETLEFVRLEGSGLPSPVYMGTTEVSVRTFGSVAGARNLWPTLVRDWGSTLRETQQDGPSVWTYQPTTNALAVNSKWVWIEGTGTGRVSNPYRVAPPPPSADLPIQRITPMAAAAFARGIGCRLPTTAEWRAARGREAAQGWNLRDQTWQSQLEFARQQQNQSTPPWFPDRGAFIPDGREGVPRDGSATTASVPADGVLFFQPVGAGVGDSFKNIVGNVAEFVDDSPAGAPEPRQYKVIGGSAISAPELGTDDPLPLSTFDYEMYMVNQDTYADVGFRLAFDAGASSGGGSSLAQQVPSILGGVTLVAPN